MAETFTWMPIYQELAKALTSWEDRQTELVALLEDIRKEVSVVTPLSDRDEEGGRFLLKEIDPFTFMGAFNRGIKDEHRLSILARMKQHFELKSPLPTDFAGIPVLNNQKSWLIAFSYRREPKDVSKLWRIFRLALECDPFTEPDFAVAFDEALAVRATNVNLTMGLFWIRPDQFLSLDSLNRDFLKLKLPSSGLSAEYYLDVLKRTADEYESIPSLSRQAWLAAMESDQVKAGPDVADEDVNYWMVGAYWTRHDSPDQTDRFLEEGIWENGYTDKYLDDVRSIQVGDRIAIKSTSTRKKNLPFDAHGNTVSVMTIKAVGTVLKNRGDGRTVEVEWEPETEERDWYFFTYQKTIWKLNLDESTKNGEYAGRLRISRSCTGHRVVRRKVVRKLRAYPGTCLCCNSIFKWSLLA